MDMTAYAEATMAVSAMLKYWNIGVVALSVWAETSARCTDAQRQARVATMQNIVKNKAEGTKKCGNKTEGELEGNTLESRIGTDEAGCTWA